MYIYMFEYRTRVVFGATMTLAHFCLHVTCISLSAKHKPKATKRLVAECLTNKQKKNTTQMNV